MSWVCYLGGQRQGERDRRITAQNLVDRPYLSGEATVFNPKTGETWKRRFGTWSKVTPASRKKAGTA